MKISEYIEQARSVAIYPDGAKFFYPTLGLVGEIGETVDKLTRLHVPSNKTEITKEIGDCLWYLVNVIEDVKLPCSIVDILEGITDKCGSTTDSFTQLGTKLIAPKDARSVFIQLLVYSGHIAEIAKKTLRDTRGVIPTNKYSELRNSLGQILLCLFDICAQWNINMDDVAQANIDKLFDRRNRGVLGGSGDNR